MSSFEKTELNRIARKPQRGNYDREAIYAIVDEALICHVGIAEGDQPVVIPTIHARIGDTIYLHGAPASRLLKTAEANAKMCITCTLVDGIVFARSSFNSSLNYRSAMLFGTGRAVTDYDEAWRAMEAITEHIAKGRWDDSRQPNEKEVAATKFVAIDIEYASSKSRSGPVGDEAEDHALPHWAGVLPLSVSAGDAQDDAHLNAGTQRPSYIKHYSRK